MNDLKRSIHTWAIKIGQRNAVGRLVSCGVSSRAAERLCSGQYPSEPKSLKDKLIAEMAKDFPGVEARRRKSAG